jgi:hypothetical protein
MPNLRLVSLFALLLYVASMFLEAVNGSSGTMRGWAVAQASLCATFESWLFALGTLANVAFLTAVALTWRHKDVAATTLTLLSAVAAGLCGLWIEDLRQHPGWWVWTSSFVVLGCPSIGPLRAWLLAPRGTLRREALRACVVALPVAIVGSWLLLPGADRWLTDAVIVPPLVAIPASTACATFVGVLAARLGLAPRSEQRSRVKKSPRAPVTSLR